MISTYLQQQTHLSQLSFFWMISDKLHYFVNFCCRQFQKTSISCGFGARHNRLNCSLAKWPSLEVSSNSRYKFWKASESKIAGSSNNNWIQELQISFLLLVLPFRIPKKSHALQNRHPVKGIPNNLYAKYTGVRCLCGLGCSSFLILLNVFLYYTVFTHTSLMNILLELETFFEVGPPHKTIHKTIAYLLKGKYRKPDGTIPET